MKTLSEAQQRVLDIAVKDGFVCSKGVPIQTIKSLEHMGLLQWVSYGKWEPVSQESPKPLKPTDPTPDPDITPNPDIIPPTRDLTVIRSRIREAFNLDVAAYGFGIALEALQTKERNYLMAGDDVMQSACCNILWEIFQGKAIEYSDYKTETEPAEIRTVVIPRIKEHGGFQWNRVEVKLRWVCPVCGGKRGEPSAKLSYDGSRRMSVDGWVNPCMHMDHYEDMIDEAKANGLNTDNPRLHIPKY